MISFLLVTDRPLPLWFRRRILPGFHLFAIVSAKVARPNVSVVTGRNIEQCIDGAITRKIRNHPRSFNILAGRFHLNLMTYPNRSAAASESIRIFSTLLLEATSSVKKKTFKQEVWFLAAWPGLSEVSGNSVSWIERLLDSSPAGFLFAVVFRCFVVSWTKKSQ